MTRRLPVSVSVPVCLAVLALCCRGESRPPSPRPSLAPPRSGNGLSVLLITIDTLRADHLGLYGYRRPTSPHIDALGQRGTVFDRAFTFWPKTRGSFVMMMTGRRPSQNGYSKTHQVLLDFNPTLAAVLKQAGYRTAAVLDNPNLAAQHGYARGFETYRETWEEPALATETDRSRAITDGGIAYLRAARPEEPFFLWLHYVNPHAPYTPPPPFDRAFLEGAGAGPILPAVSGFHSGVKKVGSAGQAPRLLRIPIRWRDRLRGRRGRPRARGPERDARGGEDGDRAHVRPRRESGRARLLLRPWRGPLRSLPGHPLDRDDARRPRRAADIGVRVYARPRAHDPRCGQGVLSARPRRHERPGRGDGRRRAWTRAPLRPERPQPQRDLRRAYAVERPSTTGPGTAPTIAA